LLNKVKLQPEQMVLESNISIEGDGVLKILSSNCRVDLDLPIEALNKECNVSGKVVTNLVYVTETGELNNQTSVSPFVHKLTNENITPATKINLCAKVVGVDFDKEIGNQVKVVVTIEFCGVLNTNKDMTYLKDCAQGVCVKNAEKEVVALKSQSCTRFEETLEATVKDGVKKVLMTNTDVLVKEWTVGTNFVSIEGEMHTKVLYANKQDPSELETITISRNFKQEIEVENTNKDFDAEIFASVINEGITVELEEKDDGDTIIGTNVPVVACVNVFETSIVLTAEDLYSTQEVLSVLNDKQDCFKPCNNEYIEEKIEGNVTLLESQPRVDKFLCANNLNVSISNNYVSDGKMYVEGIISANVIYLNDELGSLQAVEIEIPYVLNKKTEVSENAFLEAYICLSDVDVMVKRGREIYFDAKAKAFVNVSCKQPVAMVSKVESLGALPQRDGAVEIYFGKAGESFWDIAKNLKIPTETIISQNPDLVDPLDRDQNIALYFQKKLAKN